jgi:hypothetical protein
LFEEKSDNLVLKLNSCGAGKMNGLIEIRNAFGEVILEMQERLVDHLETTEHA